MTAKTFRTLSISISNIKVMNVKKQRKESNCVSLYGPIALVNAFLLEYVPYLLGHAHKDVACLLENVHTPILQAIQSQTDINNNVSDQQH